MRSIGVARLGSVVMAIGIATGLTATALAQPDGASVSDLPLVEVPSPQAGRTLAIFITGDGGWATLDRKVSAELMNHGISVVALNSRVYLSKKKRSPDDVGADLTRLSRYYMSRWNRDDLVIIGYSRGADLAPFAVSRLSDDVRRHLSLVALLGLGTVESFEFHFRDLVLPEAKHKTDLSTVAELGRAKGVKMLCVYGVDESDSGCRIADPALITQIAVPGGHHFDDKFQQLGEIILNALKN